MNLRKCLTTNQIEQQLNEWLEAEFSFLKTREPAEHISRLAVTEQGFILTWTQRVASTNIQLAYQFTLRAIELLSTQNKTVIEAWALHTMDTYDQRGLYPAMESIHNIEHFIKYRHEQAAGAVLEDNAGVLSYFVHGLSGRPLKLEEADTAYTDTETIFLPPVLAHCSNTGDNFLLYKATVAMLWAQSRFGTFRASLSKALAKHTQPKKFMALFHAMESVRLEACVERELPGLYSDINRIKPELLGTPPNTLWKSLMEALQDPGTTAEEVLKMAHIHYGTVEIPEPLVYQGIINLEASEACMNARAQKEKASFRVTLAKLLEEIKQESKQADASDSDQSKRFKIRRTPDASMPEGFRLELTLDDQPVTPPEGLSKLMTSIQLDFGNIPDDYLTPAGPGEYDPSLMTDQEPNPDDVWQGTYHEQGAFLYNEWDYRRQHYRKNWCAVREKSITAIEDDFVDKTLRKYHGLIKHLRKTFEAMRDEDRTLTRQTSGDGIDIDALVEAIAETKDGSEMTDRLFTRRHRTERNIAVVFLVDMSGSTKGWINDAERESLVLLAEALETLGDRYAIYGFSGMARKRCEIYKIKEFDEQYNDEIKARISGITPKDYTRMGFAIRHLTRLLTDIDARTRILITISDGKPDDYDHYRGTYGIEDTRRALVEARRAGIHPYCITIDNEARDYLPHMYGNTAFTVIDKVNQLPLKVSDIYRRLTT
jgi:nitric oxide reductase NorD protein